MTSKAKKETSVVVLQRQVKELTNLVGGYKALVDLLQDKLYEDGVVRDTLEVRLKRVESDLRQIFKANMEYSRPRLRSMYGTEIYYF